MKNENIAVNGSATNNNNVVDSKDLAKAKLITFLNNFNVEVEEWNKLHNSFKSVLTLETESMVSSQLCELTSLLKFLDRKGIDLVNPDGSIVDSKAVYDVADVLVDQSKIKAKGWRFGQAKTKYFKSFLADYDLVFLAVAKGAKEYDSNLDGISGKEGRQVVNFLAYLSSLGYKYKAKAKAK